MVQATICILDVYRHNDYHKAYNGLFLVGLIYHIKPGFILMIGLLNKPGQILDCNINHGLKVIIKQIIQHLFIGTNTAMQGL